MLGLRCTTYLFTLFIISKAHKWPEKNKVLHIGGIFPINGTEGWQGGMVTLRFHVSDFSH